MIAPSSAIFLTILFLDCPSSSLALSCDCACSSASSASGPCESYSCVSSSAPSPSFSSSSSRSSSSSPSGSSSSSCSSSAGFSSSGSSSPRLSSSGSSSPRFSSSGSSYLHPSPLLGPLFFILLWFLLFSFLGSWLLLRTFEFSFAWLFLDLLLSLTCWLLHHLLGREVHWHMALHIHILHRAEAKHRPIPMFHKRVFNQATFGVLANSHHLEHILIHQFGHLPMEATLNPPFLKGKFAPQPSTHSQRELCDRFESPFFQTQEALQNMV